MAKLKLMKKPSFITLENTVGLLLAVLIIFNLELDDPLWTALNNPIGIGFSLFIALLLFIKMNPVIGILFLIYLYQNIMVASKSKSKHNDKKDVVLQKLNPPSEMQVEEEIIRDMAPIKM